MKNFNAILLMPLVALLVLAISACNGEQDKSLEKSSPRLAPFVSNIDVNNSTISGVSLGVIEVISIGSSNINSFRLEGKGFSNFSISNSGEILTTPETILDCIATPLYNLQVIARNTYGDSQPMDVMIQVNCMDVPVIRPISKEIDSTTTGYIGEFLFSRTGISDVPYSDIKYIEIKGESSENFNLSNIPAIYLDIPYGYGANDKYEYLVRVVNQNDKVGPYVSMNIYVDVLE
ncbi:MAG: hypothetical protein U9N39_09340 [Campylobacterota bacterium]|nr:hypothetical protein [Campylobacterota bacterium]